MRRQVCVAVPIGIATIALLAGPAAAAETTFSETCPEVFGKGSVGDLEKDTDPAPDSMVAPGQAVNVTLRWPNKVVAGEREHRVMECASTNGEAPWLWAERRLVTAEGTTTLSMTVPSGLAAGSKVCGQSILVTKGSFGPIERWSDTTCYRVAEVEKKVMEPLSRRSPAPPPSETSTTTNEDEQKRKKEEEKRKKEEEKRKRDEEEKRKKTSTTTMPTTTTKQTEVTLPPAVAAPPPTTSSTTAPAPVVAASPPKAPQAVPSPPPAKAPITSPASQSPSRPQGSAAQPAGQLARTGTGALRLFLLGGVTLATGRLLRRVASRKSLRPRRSASSGPVPGLPELDSLNQPAPPPAEPAGETASPGS
jgi:hypothetical protein